jgi:hypothetical protein
MPRTRTKKPVHLEVTSLTPIWPVMEEWERALIEPVLARLFDVRKAISAEPKAVRDGGEAR